MLHLPVIAGETEQPESNPSGVAKSPSQIWQAVTARLPALGNTAQDDRYFLREVADHEVFKAHLPRDQQWTGRGKRPRSETPVNPQKTPGSAWDVVLQSRRIAIPDNERIDFFRQQYHDEAFWVTKTLQRAKHFAGYIVESLDTRYLPAELALLPAIESGYRPDAYSKRDAAGLWQLIPATALEAGVSRTPWFDGRNDIRISTAAAMDYLSYLNAEFNGDWLLTLAAYNAGPGRVSREIKKNALNGKATDFWSLNLPTETRNYVPKFLALLAMLRHDKVANLEIPVISQGAAFDVVTVDQQLSLSEAANLTGLHLAAVKHLNTALTGDITPPDGPHTIYLPKGYEPQFLAKLGFRSDSGHSKHASRHTVAAGDTVIGIARKYGISQTRLMKMNLLHSPDIQIGQQLYVTERIPTDDTAMQYTVTIGDTLSDIAARFSVSVADIRDEYGQVLTSDIIRPGEKLSFIAKVHDGLLR
jgi:membrane-bound lytic murein transglycosylase D